MKSLLAIATLALLIATGWWERTQTDRLRANNEALRADQREVERLAAEKREQPKLSAAPSEPEPQGGKTELLRLRNEVRQVRAQQLEADELRSGNQRVAEEIKSGRFTPRRITDVEGTVAREQWKFAGLATPEAAMQSFFAALASGDPEEFIRCATPDAAQSFRQQLATDPEGFRKMIQKELGSISKLAGFRIVGTQPLGANNNEIEVLVQVVADGAVVPFPLRRVGNEWRFGN